MWKPQSAEIKIIENKITKTNAVEHKNAKNSNRIREVSAIDIVYRRS